MSMRILVVDDEPQIRRVMKHTLAAQSYQTFVKVAGENAHLPAGTPGEVLTAIDDSLRDGNFAVWLPLLTPAE